MASKGTGQCRSGATSGWKCAAVNGADLTRTYSDGATIKHLWRIGRPSQPGDSGGSIVAIRTDGLYFNGIVSATDGTNTYYTPNRWAKSIYGDSLRPCINAACS